MDKQCSLGTFENAVYFQIGCVHAFNRALSKPLYGKMIHQFSIFEKASHNVVLLGEGRLHILNLQVCSPRTPSSTMVLDKATRFK